METSKFLELVASGQAAEAKDALNELLASRSFEALDARKVELAKTIFNGVQEPEVQETEDTTTAE